MRRWRANVDDIEGVIFDLDGVLLDSEGAWDEARRSVARVEGGRWHGAATRDMMGMSSPEWSRYMHEQLAVPMPAAEISTAVVKRVSALFARNLPLFPGAREAVALMGERWPLALASSSNREVIDLVLELAQMKDAFSATVSSEEVARGKPAPDVFLRAAELLRLDARRCVAVEDSTNGILAAKGAEMRVVAVPNREFPPNDDAVSKADMILQAISHLSPAAMESGLGTTYLSEG